VLSFVRLRSCAEFKDCAKESFIRAWFDMFVPPLPLAFLPLPSPWCGRRVAVEVGQDEDDRVVMFLFCFVQTKSMKL
jgi:hypothetical protein